MCDQLRADHLGCYGIRAFQRRTSTRWRRTAHCSSARRSVRRVRTVAHELLYRPLRVQSRRNLESVPLSLAEYTLGTTCAAPGGELTLIGKTHFMPDLHGLAGCRWTARTHWTSARARQFVRNPAPRWPSRRSRRRANAQWLREPRLCRARIPDRTYVIAVADDEGQVRSGWQMRNARFPARVREPHSETAYTTDLALDFVRAQGDRHGRCIFLTSRPHWPYIAPATISAGALGVRGWERRTRQAWRSGIRRDHWSHTGLYERVPAPPR